MIKILKKSILVTIFCFFTSMIAEADTHENSLRNIKKMLVEKANSKWEQETEIQIKKMLEAEKRGEFSSISPPKSMKPFKNWDFYYLDGEMTWHPNAGQEQKRVNVPIGFVTDMASIPKLLWSFGLKPEGAYTYAAVIHDFLYWTQTTSRKDADQIFLYAMEDSKVNKNLRESIYKTVRLFGGNAWQNNKRLKQKGEKRMLKKLPTDFTTTWEEWKKKADVFY